MADPLLFLRSTYAPIGPEPEFAPLSSLAKTEADFVNISARRRRTSFAIARLPAFNAPLSQTPRRSQQRQCVRCPVAPHTNSN
jgi:hypothetical protein